jgi:hypothetical protein
MAENSEEVMLIICFCGCVVAQAKDCKTAFTVVPYFLNGRATHMWCMDDKFSRP